MILPGAQALLGFQLLVVLTQAFEKLPTHSKVMHAVALGLVALCTVLLMGQRPITGSSTPAKHRSVCINWAAGSLWRRRSPWLSVWRRMCMSSLPRLRERSSD
jgi:hypothetical protein